MGFYPLVFNKSQSSLFEYLGTGFEKGICDQVEIDSIIQESDGLDEYKKYIKQASIAFANNKNTLLYPEDFEF